MGRFRSWKKKRVYRPELLLQQLEERIVLDAAVNPAPQDNPTDHPASTQDHVDGIATSPAADAAAAGGAGGGDAGLVAQLPDSYNHVFSENLNVVLISGDLADVKTISDAAQHDAKVITYDAEHDNLATITAKLQDLVNATGQKIHDLAIVGHSSEGILSIGTDQIQFFTLGNYKATFESLGQMLTQDAQIQFYGCSVAGDVFGQAMVDRIAIYTTADTFASIDTTGGARHDWSLEFSSNSTVHMDTILATDALSSVQALEVVSVFTEIQPGAASGWGLYSDNPLFTNVNGSLFFIASNGGSNVELWFSDGQAGAGHTYQVTEINPGTVSSLPNDLVSFNGKLYFTADDGTHGRELWVSDGTAGGTHLFADINPTGNATGFGTAGANNLTVFNGHLYFTANDGSTGTELWVTDGVYTSATVDPLHTHIVKDLTPPTTNAGSSIISNLTVVNDNLYFAGITATKNLWKTDGTDLGTKQVSTVPSNVTSMVNFNGTLFFSATGNNLGQELWMSDGTSWGTTQFADQSVGAGGINPALLTVVNDYLFYTNNLTIYGTDGVSAPTAISAPGASSFFGIKWLTESGGKLFWNESSALTTNTQQLWMYDPAAGLGGSAVNLTQSLNGVMNIGLWQSTPIMNANGNPYFTYDSTPYGWEIFDYNIGTGLITPHEALAGAGGNTNANFPFFMNGSVFWHAYTSTSGRELYRDANAPWETAADAPVNSVGALGTFAEDTAGLLDLGAGSWSVSDPNGDNLTVKLVASAGFSGITLDNGATFHKAITLTGDATTISTTLHNLKGQLKPNFSGTAEIDITSTDPSGWSDTDRMFATVTPVPDAPTLTIPVSAASLTEDVNVATPIALASATSIFKVFDADPGDVLTLTATVGQGFAEVSLANLPGTFGTSFSITDTWDNINSQLAGNKIFVKTQADFNGTAQLLFTVSDGVNPLVSGTYSKVVTAVNDAPVNNNLPIGVQTDLPLAGGLITEDTPVVFSTANGNLITISDVDLPFGTPTADYTVDLTTAKTGIGDTGTVQVVVDPLHALTSLAGNGTSHVTLTGTLDNINWALDGMAFVPYAENYVYTGSSNAALQIVTNDHGNIMPAPVSALSDTDTINFTVQPVPDAPVNTVHTINVLANSPTTISLAGGLSVHDGDVGDTMFVNVKAGANVIGLGYGSGTTFAPEYVFMGTESYLNTFLSGLKAQVAPGWSGTAEVLITTTDVGGLTTTPVTQTMLIDVTAGPTSAPPVITTDVVVTGFTVNEDNDGLGAVSLGTHVSVTDVNSDPLTVELTALPGDGWSGFSATASPGVTVSGDGITTPMIIDGSLATYANLEATLATLTGTLSTNFNGPATFSVTATDNINPPVTPLSVGIPIIAVNDAATVNPQTVNLSEDPAAPVEIVLSGNPGPTDEQGQVLTYTLGDLSGIHGQLFSDALGQNPLLTGATLVAGVPGQTSVSVYYQPDADYNVANGAASFTYSATDDGGTPVQGTNNLATVDLNVAAVNDAATVTPQTVNLTQDPAAPAEIVLSGNPGPADEQGQILTYTLGDLSGIHGQLFSDALGQNQLLTGATLVAGAPGQTSVTVYYQPDLGFNGSAGFTYSATDDGGTPVQGTNDPAGVNINVGALANLAPQIAIQSAAPQTDPSGAVIFDSAHGNLISISDVDAATGQLKVTLTATHGTMTLNGVAGLIFDPGQGDGTADATMTFTGTLTDINNALNGMSFHRDAAYTIGPADVTINVNDQGNTGTGGAQVVNAVETISVEPYNVWFAGFDSEAGWNVFNYADGSYYTHDNAIYWNYVTATAQWNFYDGTAWVSTNALGNAPYIGGFGPPNQWFPETTGAYSGYDVYIQTGYGLTYFTNDHGATYWDVTNAGAWSFYDGTAWYGTAGFNVEPMNVWFHGYGPDAGWLTYNYADGSYWTHDNVVYWNYVTATLQYYYYNGTAWVPTTGLGIVA